MKLQIKYFIPLLLHAVITISAQLSEFKPIQDPFLEGSFLIPKSDLIQTDSSITVFYYDSYHLYAARTTNYGEEWDFSESLSSLLPRAYFRSHSVIKSGSRYYIAQSNFGENIDIVELSTNLEILVTYNSSNMLFENPKLIDDYKDHFYLFGTEDFTRLKRTSSHNKGFGWSEEETVYDFNEENEYFDIFKYQDDKLLLVYQTTIPDTGFVFLSSSDYGITWSDSSFYSFPDIKYNNYKFFKTIDDRLFFIYDMIETYSSAGTTIKQKDIFYMVSSDTGKSWSDIERFTSYLGHDQIISIPIQSDDPVVIIGSQRDDYPITHTFMANLDSSVDNEPPLLLYFKVPGSKPIPFDSSFHVSAKILDRNGVKAVSVELAGSIFELYDDGIHNDSSSNDNIYAADIVMPDLSAEPKRIKTINVNNIYLPFNNYGILADVNYDGVTKDINLLITDNEMNKLTSKKQVTGIEDPKFTGSLGKIDDIGFLFSAGPILTGYADRELFACGMFSTSLIEDFVSGPVGSNPSDPDNKIYGVNEKSVPFGYEWQNWQNAVEQGAYFYDGNNDGEYNPVDINNNGSWDLGEDRPDLLYDETYFALYNDGKSASDRRYDNVDQVGIEIRQTIFASARNTLLDNTIFIRYSLVNTGLIADTLKDVIFSMAGDPDLGDHENDKVAIDTSLKSAVTYNDEGEEFLFGYNAPAVFVTLLQGPAIYTGDDGNTAVNRKGFLIGEEVRNGYKNSDIGSHIFYQSSDPVLGDPDNETEARYYMLGLNRQGEVVDPCEFSLGEVIGLDCNEVNPLFWMSGDPVINHGWIYTQSTDVRQMLNTEKFDLPKNEPTDIIVAYTVERGTDHLNSITKARETVRNVIEEYNNNFSTIVGVNDERDDIVNDYKLYQNYPNPFNPTTTIKFSIPAVGTTPASAADGRELSLHVELIVYDILGREIKTLVDKQMIPGSYEVDFDASQLASGVYLYRIKSGGFVQTKKMILIK